jgi:hypothetical protein
MVRLFDPIHLDLVSCLLMLVSLAPSARGQFRVSHSRYRGLGGATKSCNVRKTLRRLSTTAVLRRDGFMAGDGVWVKSPRDVSYPSLDCRRARN